jgi:hypothetical protein
MRAGLSMRDLPRFSSYNAPNVRLGHVELLGYGPLANPVAVEFPYCGHNRPRQLNASDVFPFGGPVRAGIPPVGRTSWGFFGMGVVSVISSHRLSTLSHHVGLIIRLGPSKKMSWIATGPIVTVVQRKQRERVFPGGRKVGYPTGNKPPSASGKVPVAVVEGSGRPSPAIPFRPLAGCLVNVAPEPSNILCRKRRKWFTICFRHLIPPMDLLPSGRVLKHPPAPLYCIKTKGEHHVEQCYPLRH